MCLHNLTVFCFVSGKKMTSSEGVGRTSCKNAPTSLKSLTPIWYQLIMFLPKYCLDSLVVERKPYRRDKITLRRLYWNGLIIFHWKAYQNKFIKRYFMKVMPYPSLKWFIIFELFQYPCQVFVAKTIGWFMTRVSRIFGQIWRTDSFHRGYSP